MLYLVALVLPPLAVLLCGKPFQALLSILLTLLCIIPCQFYAVLVVHKRLQRFEDAMRRGGA